jgi:hypothetical protein
MKVVHRRRAVRTAANFQQAINDGLKSHPKLILGFVFGQGTYTISDQRGSQNSTEASFDSSRGERGSGRDRFGSGLSVRASSGSARVLRQRRRESGDADQRAQAEPQLSNLLGGVVPGCPRLQYLDAHGFVAQPGEVVVEDELNPCAAGPAARPEPVDVSHAGQRPGVVAVLLCAVGQSVVHEAMCARCDSPRSHGVESGLVTRKGRSPWNPFGGAVVSDRPRRPPDRSPLSFDRSQGCASCLNL